MKRLYSSWRADYNKLPMGQSQSPMAAPTIEASRCTGCGVWLLPVHESHPDNTAFQNHTKLVVSSNLFAQLGRIVSPNSANGGLVASTGWARVTGVVGKIPAH